MKKEQISLIELSKTFFIIGIIGISSWGASIALIQDYCVEKKNWLSMDEFSHGLALGQFLGPFVLNITIFAGYRIRGLKGAIVALIAFLIPSITYVILLSALYMKFHKIPSLQSALRGVSPAIVALILSVAYRIGKGRMKSVEPYILILITIILFAIVNFPVVGILLLALLYGFIKTKNLNLEECK